MARPRTSVGTFGTITVVRERGPNAYVARTRYRDWDGRLRKIEARGATRHQAARELKERIAARGQHTGGEGELRPDSPFPELVEYWLQDLDLEGRVTITTRQLYEKEMRNLVLPAFEHFTLREITVSRVDRFLKQQAKISYSRAKHAKVVLGLALGLAVRHEAIPRNPVRETARLRKPPSKPTSLTMEQITAIRAVVSSWRQGPGLPGPRPDGQLGAIIEVMLGTSGRIGEVLALRRCDVDVASAVPTAHICGTIITPKGRLPERQDRPKTHASTRRVALPSFAAEAIRQRLSASGGLEEDHLLFFSRNQTPLTPNNVRRQLRAVLEEAGIAGVTPHSFRRTVATTLDRTVGTDLAAKTLGHSSDQITIEYYIERQALVDPAAAQALEQLAPPLEERARGGEVG